MEWFSGNADKSIKTGANVLHCYGTLYSQYKWSFSNRKRLRKCSHLIEELQGNTSQGKSMREENKAGRRTGGTGTVCCMVCLVPSHSVISMGYSLSMTPGVCWHSVNQSQETQGWTRRTSATRARRKTDKKTFRKHLNCGWEIVENSVCVLLHSFSVVSVICVDSCVFAVGVVADNLGLF